ncbi:MAG TPA: hypothetical protein VIH72_13305 [Candidatus Acidoferrales bacterium]
MNAGDAFLLPDWTGRHLHVVLAVLADGSFILCHFTTRRRHSDPTCVIQPGEHSFVVVETAVRYDQTYFCSDAGLQALERDIVKRFEPLSAALLQKVRRGALDSPQTPDKIKNALRGLSPRA